MNAKHLVQWLVHNQHSINSDKNNYDYSIMIEFSAYWEVFGSLLSPGTECELPAGYPGDA